MINQAVIVNAFTVDVEEYFQVSAFQNVIPRNQWDEISGRVVAPTLQLLDLLAEKRVQATFFVLGWVAERQPKLVRQIKASGHEVATHGYNHELIYNQTPEAFRKDLRKSLSILEDLTGDTVVSYRAPSFSITRQSLWALEILAEQNIQYDASIYPIYHDRYGIPGAPPAPFQVETPSGTIWEFPGTSFRWAGLNFPVGGGGYFRLYPLWLTSRILKSVNNRGRPVIFYIHPWELDPEQPRIKVASRFAQFRHYINLHRTGRKLRRILSQFRWGSLATAVRSFSDHQGSFLKIPVAALMAYA